MEAFELAGLLRDYCEHLETRNFASGTVRNAKLYIGGFADWLGERGVEDARLVTKPMLERYQRHLFRYRKKNGEPLSFGNQHVRLTTIRGFFKWLCRRDVLLANPAADLEMPKVGQRLPKAVLTAREVEQVLNVPDLSTPVGVRNRAILETLYSSGIRRKELANLRLDDVDLERGTVLVRKGKGDKDRLLPLGRRAAAWVRKYVEEARGQIAFKDGDKALFLSNSGIPITPGILGNLVRSLVAKAEIGKTGSCHLFRHAMATLMLEGGADLRHVQEMLGHARLNTTEIYTHVSIGKLIEAHRLSHPAEARGLE
ncbi:site-specific tyrosine recombinase XerC [Pelagicoccus sp. NFK12]|uniref:Site-specific tyrosine recombinase XerC n=1 Tax=Pelagicoccus enzymogenes TaxID=2773457 RepID=A0A927F5X7_9BACT|nr:site-specific tyrosine recombinase XerC [Pelagicoccus enzymogenes]MBD5778286.1 site-specific tyrosine recombinase XerC [Pelagicoccus enzymogenes]